MDGRRHSVDVPISRTLIALRRVRSLRDPSTNSMSKLYALVDNLNWETNSNNAITLGFENSFCRGSNDNGNELYDGSRNCNSKPVSSLTSGSTARRSLDVEALNAYPLDPEMVYNNKALSDRYCEEHGDKGLDPTFASPSRDSAEARGFCNERDGMLMQTKKRHNGSSKGKSWHKNLDELPRVSAGDVLSRAGSPCLSINEAPKRGSRHGIPLYRNDDAGFMEFCHQGCGISSCWSRTTKFRESNLLPDEERPLMLGNGDQLLVTGNGLDWKANSEGVSPFVESPRSFCQKFMPKSFDELVGQKPVTTSLMSAIKNRRIASLYIFDGPRGTGKTSASRIFAAALNCLSPDIGRPCGLCQECVLFFSGKSRDVKEVDSVRINRKERCRLLIKNAGVPPVLSKFKVYIIDDCHLLLRETWATILNSLDELPQCVVFVMVTPNLDKLPHDAVSKSQRYHFQKVKAVDITSWLEKICVQEGLDYDLYALNFIATKSNGSLRDAETMLDQLSLLGKKITVSLVYEVNGFVSNDELLDLLHLALSSDASNTVKKARDLLESRVDPLQLISQLANLIMDILAGKCPDGVSEVRRKLFGTNNSEDLQQLSYALKKLLQTEKQLRTSKNQMTWLIAGLLQLSSTGSLNEASDARLSVKTLEPQDGDFVSTSSTGESLKHPVVHACEDVESRKTGLHDGEENLQLVWMRATGMCTSSSVKKFLQKRGKLVSIGVTQGIAVAELEFGRSDYVSKAEKSWKVIAGALQHVLGYNVELRINLARNASNKSMKPYFVSLFNCSRRMHLRSHCSAECGSNASRNSDAAPLTAIKRDKYVETCSSEGRSQISCTCCHGKELFKTIRSNEGNALSIGVSTPNGSLVESIEREGQSGTYPLNKQINERFPNSNALKPESKPSPKEHSKFCCWRTAMLPFRKAWQLRHQQRREHLMDYALHCASAN